MENILNYLFPPKCLFCGSVGDIFCDLCLGECTLIPVQYCVCCDGPSESGFTHSTCVKKSKKMVPSRMLCIYKYDGKVRECIKFSKYGARQFLSLRKLCIEAVSVYNETWGIPVADICIPVPSSPKKLSFRGFNQANMIAEEITKRFGIVMNKTVLIRTRSTEAQHTKGREERKENVKDAFAVTSPSQIRGKKILVVDDISTTGATFLESARALYAAGATDVQCFALSKREKFLL